MSATLVTKPSATGAPPLNLLLHTSLQLYLDTPKLTLPATMRLSTLPLLLVSSSLVSAGNFFQQQAIGIHDIVGGKTVGKAVPGESPLFFCGDTSNDIVTIETVDLLPNPPTPFVSPARLGRPWRPR